LTPEEVPVEHQHEEEQRAAKRTEEVRTEPANRGDLRAGALQEQLRQLHDAALLASQGMFRCQACGRERPFEAGLVCLARRSVLFGLCMSHDCLAGGMTIAPLSDGTGLGVKRHQATRAISIVPESALSALQAVHPEKAATTFKVGE